MVVVQVRFHFGPKTWTRDFEVEDGSMVSKLKEQMLRSQGAAEDINAFELRHDGARIPDTGFIWKDAAVDFKFLGAERGHHRASKDASKAAANRAVAADRWNATLQDVLAIQTDLIGGFERASFQKQLEDLVAKLSGKENERKFNVERQKLFLTVQSVVLPKWGFPGSVKGVFEMMQALQQPQFNGDSDFQTNGYILTQLLRLPGGPPPPPQPSSQSEPEAPKFTKEKLVVIVQELTASLCSNEARGLLDSMAKQHGSASPELTKAGEAVIYHTHTDVMSKHGIEFSESSNAAMWSALDNFEHDSELGPLIKSFKAALGYRGPEIDASGFSGAWSMLGSSVVNTTSQSGLHVTLTCPAESWSPAKGIVEDNGVLRMTSPSSVRGWHAALEGDTLTWTNGDVWHRHVATQIVLKWNPGDPSQEMTLEVAAGSTVNWIKEVLCKLDPDGRTQPSDLHIVSTEGPRRELDEGCVILRALGKFRLLPQPGEEPQADKTSPEPEAVETAAAKDGDDEEEERPPGTPRTSSQLFDFNDLEDF